MSSQKARQSRGWLIALAYFDALGLPLNTRELRRYTWMADPAPDAIAEAAKQWKKSWAGMNWYSLRELNGIWMEENLQRVAEYWRWVGRRRAILAWVPFVELVMVMNAMAHGAVKESSDIDLFVVARPGRVWLARAIMLGLLTVFGLRARPGNMAKRFSPEFFVDSNHMDMEVVGSQSTYLTAFWVADFTPIVYPQNFDKFWSANAWLKKYLPVAYKSPRRFAGGANQPAIVRLIERILAGRLGDIMEKKCQNFQSGIIQKNLQAVGIQPGTLTDETTIKILWPLNIRRAEAVEREVAEFLAGVRG
jgi:hypothetical protein